MSKWLINASTEGPATKFIKIAGYCLFHEDIFISTEPITRTDTYRVHAEIEKLSVPELQEVFATNFEDYKSKLATTEEYTQELKDEYINIAKAFIEQGTIL